MSNFGLGQRATEICKRVRAVDPAAKTGNFNSQTMDRFRYNQALFVVPVGAVTGSSPTCDFTVKSGAESDGSDKAALSADDVRFGDVTKQITDADANSAVSWDTDLLEAGRYVTVDAVLGGGTPNFTLGMVMILFDPADVYPAA